MTEVGVGAPEGEIQALIDEHAGVLSGEEEQAIAPDLLADLKVPDEVMKAVEGRVAKWEEMAAKSEGITVEELQKMVDKSLNEVVGKADIFVRVPDDVVEKILEEGRFKNQFETGRTRGMFDLELRKQVELNVMGVSGLTSAKDRPIYGYLSSTSPHVPEAIGARHAQMSTHQNTGLFGNTVIKMKEVVRKRTTFTFQDSLGDANSAVASPINKPGIRSMNSFMHSSARSGEVPDFIKKKDVDLVEGYFEVQIHKGLSVSDIEHLSFREKPSEVVESLLKEKGIPWDVMK